MNETEIEDMVGNDCLDGISVKPLSARTLSDILFTTALIDKMVS